MANGCGITGLLSIVWKWCSGHLPPFESCCDEHDLAYEQIESESDRAWADAHFQRCVEAKGYKLPSYVMFILVRYVGWLAVLKYKLLEKPSK